PATGTNHTQPQRPSPRQECVSHLGNGATGWGIIRMGESPVEVIKISPRGYCYGVVDAINLAKKAAQDPYVPKPVYILGAIVHNRHAVESLEQYGIISLDGPDREALLDQVTGGTVIFTAHGVSPAVKRKAKEKGLYCIDATCPDVTRTHALVRE